MNVFFKLIYTSSLRMTNYSVVDVLTFLKRVIVIMFIQLFVRDSLSIASNGAIFLQEFLRNS